MAKNTPTSWEKEIFSENFISHFKNDGLWVYELQSDGAENAKNHLEMYIWEYFKRSSETLKNEKLLSTVTREIFTKISLLPWAKMEDLQTVEIRSAMMIVTKTDGSRHSVNLIDVWRDVFVEPKKAEIRQKAREEEQKLQEIVAKDAFYNGSVVLEYVAGSAVLGLGAAGVISIGKGVGNKVLAATSMTVTLEDGSKQKIFFKKPYVGTRESFPEAINRIMSVSGFQYDTTTKKFYSPEVRMRKAVADDIENLKKLTYEDFLKKSENMPDAPKMSEKQFEAWKEKILQKNNSTLSAWKAGKISGAEVMKMFQKEMTAVVAFFPLFSIEYHRTQNPFYIAEAIGEEIAMAGGAVALARIAPWAWKIPAAIVGMAGGLLGFGKLEEYLEVKRRKWLYIQEWNYKNDRSTALHTAFSFRANEGLGHINELWRNLSGDKNAGGMDFWISATHIMNPFTGKKIFSLPEVSFYKDKITMATNPWDWIAHSKKRDIHEWNRYVDMYKIQATESIHSLLGKYIRGESIFWDAEVVKKAGGKEKLLESSLLAVLSGDDVGKVFVNERANIISGIMSEITANATLPNPVINDYIAKNISAMKIDSLYIMERKVENLKNLHKLWDSLKTEFPNVDEESKKLIATFPEKMLKNVPLYKDESEKKMYEKLLTRTDIVPWTQDLAFGNAFAEWLDQLVEWKNERYFLEQLEKNNSQGIKWAF